MKQQTPVDMTNNLKLIGFPTAEDGLIGAIGQALR
jgi:hypothetical protein